MKILLETSQTVGLADRIGMSVLVSMQEENSDIFVPVFSHETDKFTKPLHAIKFVMENMDKLIAKGLENGQE